MSSRWVPVLPLLAACLLAASCSSAPEQNWTSPVSITTNAPRPPVPAASFDGFPRLGGTEAGALLNITAFDTVEPRLLETGASAFRIRYLSTPSTGQGTVEVTGTLFVPGGIAPRDGWEVIAFDHGNTGISPNCGPSLYDDLRSEWAPIAALLTQGYLVVASDYEGLGDPTGSALKHSLLDSTALGKNVIDAVRAARQARPDIGNRWATFGGSLGGLASWAANEQAGTYGAGLELVGAAAFSPAVDISEMPVRATAGTLTRDQLNIYFLAVMSMKAVGHPELNLTDYVRGAWFDNRDLLLQCTGAGVARSREIVSSASAVDLVPVDVQAEQQMRRWLQELAVPKQAMAAPMLVYYGSADELISPEWIETAIRRGCALGDSISWKVAVGAGHDGFDTSGSLEWIAARFDDQAPLDMCSNGDR